MSLQWETFFKGAIMMGFLVGAGFFLRYWRESRDRLFALFAVAFAMLAANRLLLVLLHESRETNLLPYTVRLAAFLTILVAVVDKNLRRTGTPRQLSVPRNLNLAGLPSSAAGVVPTEGKTQMNLNDEPSTRS